MGGMIEQARFVFNSANTFSGTGVDSGLAGARAFVADGIVGFRAILGLANVNAPISIAQGLLRIQAEEKGNPGTYMDVMTHLVLAYYEGGATGNPSGSFVQAPVEMAYPYILRPKDTASRHPDGSPVAWRAYMDLNALFGTGANTDWVGVWHVAHA